MDLIVLRLPNRNECIAFWPLCKFYVNKAERKYSAEKSA